MTPPFQCPATLIVRGEAEEFSLICSKRVDHEGNVHYDPLTLSYWEVTLP